MGKLGLVLEALALVTMVFPGFVQPAVAPCEYQPEGPCCIYAPDTNPEFPPSEAMLLGLCYWPCPPNPPPGQTCPTCWNPYVPEWTCEG